jgi:predicted alpha/beta superfamily hydrolase
LPAIASDRGFFSAHPKFLIKEVMRAVAIRYRVAVGPENTGAGGSSYCGMAALFTVMHNPDIFGRLMLESTPIFMAKCAALNEAERTRNWPASVYMGVGTKENPDPSLSREAAINVEKLRSAIGKNSSRSRVKVAVDEGAEHGSAAWRNRPKAIAFLWGHKKSRS